MEPFCIINEYLDGGCLFDYLRQEDMKFSVSIAMSFIKEILFGIQHLHENNIIHRDLATRNVLFRKDKDPNITPHCVLTDMGLARLFEREETYMRTRTATMPLKWSAPELLKEKKYSQKSDIWSFGIVCIEIFTRNLPFPEKSNLEFAIELMAGKIKPEIPQYCPDFFKPMLQSCYSFEPNQRPTANELVSFLEQNK